MGAARLVPAAHTLEPMPRHITVTRDGDVAHLRLARPEKLNGLTLEMLDDLVSSAGELRRDRDLRAVILSGEGDSFCAGLDFATATKDPVGIAKAFAPRPWRGTNTFQEACWALRRIPVPVVAAVHGHCFGGGVQLALAADLRITRADATWSVLEGRWGLIPDMSGVHALSQLVGIDVAKKLTMTAEMISGDEAVRLGLATETADDPVAAATELAGRLALRSPDALAATKRVFDRTWTSGPRRTFARERAEQLGLLVAQNTRRAREAAFRRTAPDFRPRARRVVP